MTNKDRFYQALNAVVIICAIANFVVVGWSIAKSRPQIEEHNHQFVTNHFFVVTQYVHSVSSSQDDRRLDVVGVEIPIRYHYFLEDGRRFARFFGRVFGEGSLCSYGRIDRIFPERIKLEEGVFIKNTFDVEEDERRRDEFTRRDSEKPVKKEALANERIRDTVPVL